MGAGGQLLLHAKRPLGAFQKWGYINSWMVYKGKSMTIYDNPIKIDDLGNLGAPFMESYGTPHFL